MCHVVTLVMLLPMIGSVDNLDAEGIDIGLRGATLDLTIRKLT